MKLNRKAQVIRELLGVYVEAQDVWMTSKRDASRIKFLRPSQMPFCPINFFVQHATLGMVSTMDFMGSYYTEVGTAVHSVMQRFLSPSGRFLADWECKSCGRWRRMSTKSECCDHTMDYHELLINIKGVVGHIDAVFKTANGKYWILDFKTCSLKGAPTKKNRPGTAYIEQVETYALMLYLQYGIKVEGVMLMFLPRDNPKEPAVWAELINRKNFKTVWERIKVYKKGHKQALAVKKASEAIALAKYGRCKGEWCKTCRSTKSLEDQLKLAHKRGKAAGHLPIAELQ